MVSNQNQTDEPKLDLTDINVVRKHFASIRRRKGGWKALNDAAILAYRRDRSGKLSGKPVAANTFKMLIQGGLPSNIPGTLAYFHVLGATSEQLEIIERTLNNELKIEMSREEVAGVMSEIPALDKAVMHDVDSKLIPIMRQISQLTNWPIHVTLNQHIIGTDAGAWAANELPDNRRDWGILHYLDDLFQKTSKKIGELEKEEQRSAVGVVDKYANRISVLAEQYKEYLVRNPAFAQMAIAPKVNLVDVAVSTYHVTRAKQSSLMCMKDMFHSVRELHAEVFLGVGESDIFISAEMGMEGVIAHVHSYCTNVVFGSMGTSALFSGLHGFRKDPSTRNGKWDGSMQHNDYLALEDGYTEFLTKRATPDPDSKLSELSQAYADYQAGLSQAGQTAHELWARIWTQRWKPALLSRALREPFDALRRAGLLVESETVAGRVDALALGELRQPLV